MQSQDNSGIDVLVSEVGPRDGLQMLARTMPTHAKLRWIEALAHAGLPEIEVGSCVSPKRLPQMADTDDVIAHAVNNTQGTVILALVPNLRGAERAFAAGAHKVTIPVSASRAHSQANLGMTPEDVIAQIRAIDALRRSWPGTKPRVEVGISTAFGCTMEGRIDEDWVIRLASMAAEAGADSVGLSDTTGMGNPAQVKRLFTALIRDLGMKAGGAHFHNTRGQGLANVVAAIDVGVTAFDSSQAGLGGCPYAPGASGNIVTEDLVFMLEAMGLHTGIDLDKLADARRILAESLPDETLYGHVPEAGLPVGFLYARS
ncbi:hydroxymethylglutaryl-CoA lyase [Rhizobiales bacterium TNE-4]|nr:hydroxymethylglutaryl-CoA lyase [Rhizobiales bacterium TNE-4]MBV1828306.1 hydroxymethylglutaryl-CoA lyase [Rhizobiales bacterium TNE-4]